ncbi:flagellar hook-associated protein 1 FlgK [Clostridium collagenovorans DSM 3089]|uniref:Flagellar hook-associated protein 1 n=1 Tax=Clostridium collagenovorans DSM 3089 TaxID=1121306 RepID=A0A1M5WP63_9CLOT|nr:flagellar hook-associated protein FlgK [Clostridium collagenovorans]SHH89318.1 flagellar hook-associated protein 1 FlgK [Clostridium collagenovorans DSM 3089]
MANLLGSLHSAASGMRASQIAIQTTSHNVTNMKTPGYSRQRVEQSANRPFSQPGLNSHLGAGQLGTGVQVNDITRIRNSFYDFQFRSESHSYGDVSVKYDYYKSMEIIFDEPSNNSISSSLNKFFNGWNELSKDPNNVGAKNIAVENAKYLANNINKVSKKLDTLQENLNKQSEDILADVNQSLTALKDLEKSIKIVEATGKSPNDLLDERDKILDDLSFKINIYDDDVKAAMQDGKLEQAEVDKLIKDNKLSGELGATAEMNKEIDKYKEKVEELAKVIASNVNKVAGQEIFIFDAKGDEMLSVNPEILEDVSKLEMTSDLATELYKLKDKKVTFGEAPNQKELTINNFYNNTIQELGKASQTVIRQEANQSKILASIDKSRMSVSGVALDEEMINLVQFQHAYNASAKVVSTVDALLDVVINGLIR